MADYFDFHFHPLFKQFLLAFKASERQNDRCTEPVRLPGLGRIIDSLAGRILESQACVAQARQGGVHLGIACLIAIEHVLSSDKGKLALLNSQRITPLDDEFFAFVREGRGSYNDLVEMELSFYEWVAQTRSRQMKLLSRKTDAQLATGKLNLVLAMEGGHGLSRQRINEFAGPADPVATVQAYREHPTRDLLYLTLTHFSHIREQLLCSHAYAFKLVRQLAATRPQVAGLRQLGRAVVRACLDVSQNPYPIHIDIKHMSLQARLEYYAFRRELLASKNGFKAPPGGIPLLATHVGVTGFRLAGLADRLTDFGLEDALVPCVRMRTRRQVAGELSEHESVWFNSWTLNLLDDDIEEIARSGGLIGISLDVRILGFEGSAKRLLNRLELFAPDYMSPADFAALFPVLARQLPKLDLPEEEALEPLVRETELGEELFGTSRRERELYLFCLNVLHTVAVINALPAEQGKQLNGWDFVSVGSDFDGLVDSLKSCARATELPTFERELMHYFPRAERAYQAARNSTTPLLHAPGTPFNARAFQNGPLRQLLYDNGARLLSRLW
ncbi:hypothetical protein SAMN00120144_3546 [Hymenobacter roseosalivarius DSM 11622]|uniref:Uncharacterized protein n=1 Tax=Hymenobacter roseosalivarius DSM 11622 TaxID=645990 RepID=A0A1W1VJ35_9BACT|nr:hypothetical protein [Hymenobacter roseosalivarius]SMB93395.1 hypothetical protein SAMN00120144_3546 [Hymenobacter roseosalivarius DSM 11622]